MTPAKKKTTKPAAKRSTTRRTTRATGSSATRASRAAGAPARTAPARGNGGQRPALGSLGIGTLQPARGARHRKKRRGLGPASGLGGTAGRGHKGQHARSGGKVARWFEGGQMPIQRRLPKVGFTNIHRVPHQVVNVALLSRFTTGDQVNRESLKAARLIDRSDLPVKILGTGELTLTLHVSVDAVSESAKQKIEAAGGTVTLPTPKTPRPRHVKKIRPGNEGETKGARE
jgi:large subunit ribosomal protein L15